MEKRKENVDIEEQRKYSKFIESSCKKKMIIIKKSHRKIKINKSKRKKNKREETIVRKLLIHSFIFSTFLSSTYYI